MKYALIQAGAIIRTAELDAAPALAPEKGLQWLRLIEAPRPRIDVMTQGIRPAAPLIDGESVEVRWEVFPLPAEKVAENVAAMTPSLVTMRQARLALLAAGKLAAVDAAIDALPEPAKSAARIEWEYSAEVHIDSGIVAALGPALGLSVEQIQTLFTEAATL